MDRREFLKISALTTGAVIIDDPIKAFARSNTPDKTSMDILKSEEYLQNKNIKRKISGIKPLDIRKLEIKVGAKKSYSVLHISDSHLTYTDSRNDEKKAKLARYRNIEFPWANIYHERLIRYAQQNKLPIIHTGDLIDFISEMNLDYAVETFSRGGEWITSVGNHEFAEYMGYFGPEKEDAEFQAKSFVHIQEAFPNDLKFYSKIINGINFITIDNSFYFITQEQWENVASEFKKGYPCVIMMHIPLYTPKLYEHTSDGGKKFSYLCGAPLDSEHKDNLTNRFIEWLKEQAQLKAILAGHLHEFWQEEFSPTAIQYVVGGAFRGEAYQIKFI